MTLSASSIVLITIVGLAGIGFYGILVSRNMIKLIIGLQLLVKGAVLAFILAGNQNGNINEALTLALTIIVADTIVAVLGLAFAVQIRQRFGTLDIKALTTLKR
jgi:NADH:ubiquinone oxidoreductase subunit K